MLNGLMSSIGFGAYGATQEEISMARNKVNQLQAKMYAPANCFPGAMGMQCDPSLPQKHAAAVQDLQSKISGETTKKSSSGISTAEGSQIATAAITSLATIYKSKLKADAARKAARQQAVPSYHSPQIYPTAAPSRSNMGLILGLGGVALVVTIIGLVVATR